jgi:phage shock protein A
MAIKARLEALLELMLSQADDPEERIRALVDDLRRRGVEGRRALGMSIALEKRLLDDVVSAEDELSGWEKTAKEALERRDEAAATEAAARALSAKARLDERRARHADQAEAARKVRAAVLEASRRTQEVAHAKSVLLARARCAEAMQSIAESLRVIASPEVKLIEERMRAAVEAKEGL